MVVYNNLNNKNSCSSLNNGKSRRILYCFNQIWIIPCLLTFLITIACIYTLLFPNIDKILQIYTLRSSRATDSGDCNVFDGKWIEDNSGTYPIYNSSDCPFAERGFSCSENGRKDNEYLNWRWKPKECEIERFCVNIYEKSLIYAITRVRLSIFVIFLSCFLDIS